MIAPPCVDGLATRGRWFLSPIYVYSMKANTEVWGWSVILSIPASQLVNVTLCLAYVFISPGLTVVGIDYHRPSIFLLQRIARGGWDFQLFFSICIKDVFLCVVWRVAWGHGTSTARSGSKVGATIPWKVVRIRHGCVMYCSHSKFA